MTSGWLATGALACAVSIVAGAFGAHGLEARLDTRELALWETASRYLMYGGLGVVLMGLALAVQDRTAVHWAAIALASGTAVFSGTVFLLALGGPRWLGAITPLGGVGMILGFVLLAFAALRV